MPTTVRQRLKESDARLRALLEAITDHAVFLVDSRGRISSWSAGAERIEGFGEDEVLDRDFSILYRPEDVAAGKPMQGLAIAANEGRFEEEGWRIRKDGSQFIANVVTTPVRDERGELLGFAQVTRDVTHRRVEQERRSLVRSIEDRRQTAALIHMNAISLLFEVGLGLQNLAVRTRDLQLRDGLEAEVAKLDEAIKQLRSFTFDPETN